MRQVFSGLFASTVTFKISPSTLVFIDAPNPGVGVASGVGGGEVGVGVVGTGVDVL